jgi:hypothetical protein
MLAEHGKEELIAIINQMGKRDAKLLQVIELAAAGPKPDKPMNVTAYRNQAPRAMQSESLQLMVRELKSLRQTARRWLRRAIGSTRAPSTTWRSMKRLAAMTTRCTRWITTRYLRGD